MQEPVFVAAALQRSLLSFISVVVLSLCREMSGGNFKPPRELSHQKDGEVTRLPFSRIRFIFMEAIKISRDLHLNCGLSTLVSIAAVIALHTTVCITFLLAYWRKWYILIGKLLKTIPFLSVVKGIAFLKRKRWEGRSEVVAKKFLDW